MVRNILITGAAIASIWYTYFSYNSQKALREEVEKSLIAIADYKSNQIETFLNEKQKNVDFLSHTSDIIEVIDKFNKALVNFGMDSREYNAIDEEYRALSDQEMEKLFDEAEREEEENTRENDEDLENRQDKKS